jgi:predicted acetyltransferase
MARSSTARAENVEVVPALLEQQPVLANLFQLYAHDFMDFCDLELDSDGRFSYKNLPLYWSDPRRHPFLLRIDGRLAGFVLVKRGSEVSGNAAAWDVAEFFVLRSFRRRGIGAQVAHQVWERFPGTWEVRVMEANVSALHFWEHTIATFTGKPANTIPVEHDGEPWKLFSFESKTVQARVSTP